MKKNLKTFTIRLFVSLTIVLLVLAANVFSEEETYDYSFYSPSSDTTPYPLVKGGKVKNIIFFIGDGMGLTQATASRMKATGLDGKLCFERMPIIGLMRTHSHNALVTDSAAAGTALATGFKTDNGVIGMSPDKKKEYMTILEAARDKGKGTGLVATSTISHATPASYASHVELRKYEDQIAVQLIDNKVNVLLGGGKQFFLPQSASDSKRKDDIDLIAKAKDMGYSFIETGEELKSAKGPYLLGLFQLSALKLEPPEPTLAELTDKAIEILSKEKNGFFLMVEGSQIDWACHANDIGKTIKCTLRFDEAVKVGMDFALKDKNTLVIVTADHECGGLTIIGGDIKCENVKTAWSTGGHSGVPVPVYAFGPKAIEFAGVYDNTEVPKKLAELLMIKSFPVSEDIK